MWFFFLALQGLVFDKIERGTRRIDLAEVIDPGDQTGASVLEVKEKTVHQNLDSL